VCPKLPPPRPGWSARARMREPREHYYQLNRNDNWPIRPPGS